MDHLCVRCARQALRSPQPAYRDASSTLVRHFSRTSLRSAGASDNASSPRQPRSSGPSSTSSAPKVLTRKAPDSDLGFRIRRFDSKSPPAGPSKGPGVLLRRTGAPRGARTPTGRPTGAQSQRRGGQGPSSGRGKRGPRDGPDTIFDEYVEDDDDVFAQHEAALEAKQANNGLPTEALPYSPAQQSVQELRQDWPDTPLSTAGLSEGVNQQLRFLARDLPHGHWTPRQIADRMVEGGLVRFESEKQKAEVLEWAERLLDDKTLAFKRKILSQRRKDEENGKAERSAEVWAYSWLRRLMLEQGLEPGKKNDAAADTAKFMALGENDAEKKELVDSRVRGVYPELEKGQRPLLAGVQRQLRNNESYGAVDTSKFMGRITTLIGSVQKQAAQQQETAAKQ